MTGEFQLPMPSAPAGTYRLYADVVHASGFPETIVGTMTIPAISGRPLAGDDAEGTAAPVGAESAPSNSAASASSHAQSFKLPDGYTMVWIEPETIAARTPLDFEFQLLDPEGKPARDTALYMGMLGHAAFVKTDGTAFAHIHPTGTVSMAAFMMANPQSQMQGMNKGQGPATNMRDMPGMDMSGGTLPNVVSFPYGFPSAGAYRIFVQMKHGATVETGIFDATVAGAKS
jgi:hypothetical protein